MEFYQTKEFTVKKFALSLAAIAAMSSAPAYAEGEGRVEIQGGIAFSGGTSEAFAGVSGGYDFDLGDKAFVGIDLGVGKVLARGTDVVRVHWWPGWSQGR